MSICALAVVIRPSETLSRIEVLVEDRPDLRPLSERALSEHYLVFPGGQVNGSESIVQAFRREAQEELGITPVLYSRLTHQRGQADLGFHSRSIPGTRSGRVDSGWMAIPYVVHKWNFVDGRTELPTHTLDENHAPLRWVDPADLAGPADGYSAVAQVAEALIFQMADMMEGRDAAH